MQKTKIEWTDYTWNPVKGKCPVGCPYCYARRLYDRFKWNPEIRLDEKELLAPYKFKKPSKIFVGSTIELFIIEKHWFNKILRVVYDNPQHIFQFLSKYPNKFHYYFSCDESKLPDNMWLGTTVTNQKTATRVSWLMDKYLKKRENSIKFISFEPLHSFIISDLYGIDWIIIGAETGNRKGKIIPKREWIEGLVNQAKEHNIPTFFKDNLKPYWNGEWYRQFPK